MYALRLLVMCKTAGAQEYVGQVRYGSGGLGAGGVQGVGVSAGQKRYVKFLGGVAVGECEGAVRCRIGEGRERVASRSRA